MVKFAFCFMLLTATASAQVENTPGSWPSHRGVADAASYGTLFTEMGLDTLASWRAENRGRAFGCQALRVSVAVGVSELIKRAIHETRPDGSDRLSFPSEHSALAAASSGFNLSVSLPLIFGTGYGRIAANRHHWYDVAAGLAIGAGSARLCHTE
jgi:membrane-associated phospholipid phosphatase